MAQAEESSYAAYEIDMESEYYLNNAGVNGTGSTEDVAPSQPTYSTSATINGATFSDLNVAAGHNLVVYRGGTAWFTITAQDSGDPNE